MPTTTAPGSIEPTVTARSTQPVMTQTGQARAEQDDSDTDTAPAHLRAWTWLGRNKDPLQAAAMVLAAGGMVWGALQ